MIAARYAAGLLAVLCFVIVFARVTADGVLVLGTLFFVAWLATFGVFTRAFWISDDPALGELDTEIDFEDSVLTDLDALDRQGNPRV